MRSLCKWTLRPPEPLFPAALTFHKRKRPQTASCSNLRQVLENKLAGNGQFENDQRLFWPGFVLVCGWHLLLSCNKMPQCSRTKSCSAHLDNGNGLHFCPDVAIETGCMMLSTPSLLSWIVLLACICLQDHANPDMLTG
eukprot:1157749-Pelagomonas_calceolata.AAC.3